VTVISHPLGAVHHHILRSRIAICRTRGGTRHMSLVLSHLSRDDLAYLVSCFFSPMLLAVDLARPGCTSHRYPYRHLQADSIAATRLVNCRRAAMQPMRPSRPPPACRASFVVGAERHPIASLLSTAQRQRIVNTSCITGCLFDHCSTYQTPRQD
jgi:hypothetical protein